MTKCPNCWRENCFCALIKPVAAPIKLLILQHPQESRNPLSTSRLLALSIQGSVHRVGLSWRSLAAAVGGPEGAKCESKNWAILYLGSKKDSLEFSKNPEVLRLVSRSGELIEKATLEGLVVLDGNWKQSKTLWWRNPWLLRLKRVILNPDSMSHYGKLRKQPRPNCLSTLESVALCLSEMTGNASFGEGLLEAQGKFLVATKLPGNINKPEPHFSQETLN